MLPEAPNLLKSGAQHENKSQDGNVFKNLLETKSAPAPEKFNECKKEETPEFILPCNHNHEVQIGAEGDAGANGQEEVESMDESLCGKEDNEGSSSIGTNLMDKVDESKDKGDDVEIEKKINPEEDIEVDSNLGPQSPVPEEGKWEVERIIDYSTDSAGDMYLCKWKDWDEDFNTWEPPSNLLDCQHLLLDFYYIRKAEIESALEKSGYVVTSNGHKRRKGPLILQMPPDPRPLDVRANEFYEKTMYPTEEEIKYWRLLWNNLLTFERGKKSNAKDNIRWSLSRLNEVLRDGTNNKLSEENTKRLRAQLLFHGFDEQRKKAKESLKEWELDINAITEGKPIVFVENDVDCEGPPKNFTYVNDYVAAPGINIPDDPPMGCSCPGLCQDNKKLCCPVQSGYMFPYTQHHKLRVALGTPIYECNKLCKCGPDCINRVVQDGRDSLVGVKLCIFRTSNGCGWGVKTLKAIKKGSFVTLYVGEVINTEEAERRGREYDAEGCTYLFDLDFNQGDCPYTVDAAKFGNIAHFVNHSCDPNLGVFSVWVNCLDPNLPKIALFALRDIPRGEELTFDYKKQLSGDATKSAQPCPTTNPDTIDTVVNSDENGDGIDSAVISKENGHIIDSGVNSKKNGNAIKIAVNSEENGDAIDSAVNLEKNGDIINSTVKPEENGYMTESMDESSQQSLEQSPLQIRQKACLCGSDKCRKVLF